MTPEIELSDTDYNCNSHILGNKWQDSNLEQGLKY